MNPDHLIYYAAGVFLLVIIGLVITVLEFKYGAPKQQEIAAAKRRAASDAEV